MTRPGPTAESTFWQTYRRVDDSGEARAMGAYLDDVGALGPVSAAKRESLELLGLGAGDHVLDIGCGTGQEVVALAELVGPEGHVAGLDNSETLIAVASDRVRACACPIELVVGDAHSLPFPDATFDAVRADRTLQHLSDPDRALAEMTRVLRAGGTVVITEGEWSLEAPGLDSELTRRVLAQLSGAMDRRHWVGYLLPVMFRMAGLTDVRLFSYEAVIEGPSLERLLRLEWATGQLVAKGEIGPEEKQSWLTRLRAAAERGEAGGRLGLFHLAGNKPA